MDKYINKQIVSTSIKVHILINEHMYVLYIYIYIYTHTYTCLCRGCAVLLAFEFEASRLGPRSRVLQRYTVSI